MAIILKRFSKVPALDQKLNGHDWRLYCSISDTLFISNYGNTRGTEEEMEELDNYSDVWNEAFHEVSNYAGNISDIGQGKFEKGDLKYQYDTYGVESVVVPNKYLTDKNALVKFIEKHLE